MNLKKLANWSWSTSVFLCFSAFYPNIRNNHCFRLLKTVVFDSLQRRAAASKEAACPSFAVYAAETTAKDRRTAYSTGQMAKQRAGKPEPSFSLGKLQKITAPTGGT